jgi:hypothetical protein
MARPDSCGGPNRGSDGCSQDICDAAMDRPCAKILAVRGLPGFDAMCADPDRCENSLGLASSVAI